MLDATKLLTEDINHILTSRPSKEVGTTGTSYPGHCYC